LTGNVPAGGMGFKWLKAAARTHFAASGVRLLTYAMNMRAAEAIVSNAPKAMKIFPISDV
jgi:hypothetical protein